MMCFLHCISLTDLHYKSTDKLHGRDKAQGLWRWTNVMFYVFALKAHVMIIVFLLNYTYIPISYFKSM